MARFRTRADRSLRSSSGPLESSVSDWSPRLSARLTVRVQPGARTTRFTGWYGDHPRLAVAAPPVGGAANDAVRRLLAREFGVRERDVRIVIGSASRTKHVELDGVDDDTVQARLTEIVGPAPRSR